MKEGQNLVIVESPGKIKKIQAALGSDYIVKASIGHIRDLDESGLSIDVENGFKPEYVPLNTVFLISKSLRLKSQPKAELLFLPML